MAQPKWWSAPARQPERMHTPDNPAGARDALEQFLRDARDPILIEPGEDPFSLCPGSFSLDWRNGRLSVQAWDDRRNLVRRITGLREQKPGRLELVIERFGKREGQISLIDRARASPQMERRGARRVFGEQFRRFLARRFPGWRIVELSTEPNLEESLSPAYPRAFLRRGGAGWAALASPPEPGAASGALTFALIWLDYLRRRESRLTIEGLAIFLPERDARPALLRLPFLDPRAARFAGFVYSDQGYEEALDPRDCGNLDTRLEQAAPAASPPAAGWIARLRALPRVEQRRRGDGALSFHVRGLEFARLADGKLLFGIDRKTPATDANFPEIEQLAREIARLRSPSAADREHPLYRLHPEAWLESEVRSRLEQLDASLYPEPVYGQVPALAGVDRGVMDLLGVDRSGRLAVLELKASEDIHLPMQALDYWMRVKWHLDRGEFPARGYFPGIALSRQWPRLLLIAPALDFHPKTEVILRFFAPGIQVERIGLAAGWRRSLEVMFRLRGAERPK